MATSRSSVVSGNPVGSPWPPQDHQLSLVIHVTGNPVDSSWPLQVQWLSLIVQLIFHGHFKIYYLLVRLVEWKQLFIPNIDFFSFEFVSNVMKLCADVFMSVLVYMSSAIVRLAQTSDSARKSIVPRGNLDWWGNMDLKKILFLISNYGKTIP